MAKLSPRERAKLGRRIAMEVRRSQVERIAAQRNPDGSAFTPRKAQPESGRGKVGRIKRRATARAMFPKLRRAQYLRIESSPSEASVGFSNPTTARVAAVHQYGLRDRVTKKPGAAVVRYPRRVLLGLTADDDGRILDMLTAQLSD